MPLKEQPKEGERPQLDLKPEHIISPLGPGGALKEHARAVAARDREQRLSGGTDAISGGFIAQAGASLNSLFEEHPVMGTGLVAGGFGLTVALASGEALFGVVAAAATLGGAKLVSLLETKKK